jgi:hypothetical protein
MSAAPIGRYSRIDRFLHRMAFSGIEVQKSLADMEDRMHGKRLRQISLRKPVFIAGLPRAGTTLLLDMVARIPNFVTHTYRCMPFVLCPLLWDSITRGFRRPADVHERAHGDGMTVGYDSPEAFEEVIWKVFWPSHYERGHIRTWSREDRDPEFEAFFANHMRKLILLHGNRVRGRYVSKNNTNIARLNLLAELFPDCIRLIPFRDPIDQAGSLLRQHQRFAALHRDDAFARFYMDAIGHFEFGAGMRPIAFPADSTETSLDPGGGNYWLSYWCAAYAHILRDDGSARHFIDFDAFCAQPAMALERLSRVLDEPGSGEPLRDCASLFHPAVRYDSDSLSLEPRLVAHARSLHRELRSRARLD